MKNLITFCSILLLAIVSSCKKDRPTKADTPENEPAVVAAVHDSVSYTVDGKVYTTGSDASSFSSSGGQEIDRKVVYPDSTNKTNYGLVGNPDSVLYYQKNTISSENINKVTIFFIKKFIKKQKGDGVLYFPIMNDWLQLFVVGKHPYAEDFGWQNSQDGIALYVAIDDGNYISYNPFNPNKPNILKPGFQKKSTFEITNFTKTDRGYNFEAKFTAVITDALTQKQKKLENGYLRLYISPDVIAEPTAQ